MAFLYKSERVGKRGIVFPMYKIRTLKTSSSQFAHENGYTFCGRFLRKYRLDELPQIFALIKYMRPVGIRPMEYQTYILYPEHIREKLVSLRPGWFSLSGVFFMEEEKLLELSENPHETYYAKIVPIKLALDMFWLENRSILLDLAIIYSGFKKAFLSIWK